jgi:hypothetical protein
LDRLKNYAVLETTLETTFNEKLGLIDGETLDEKLNEKLGLKDGETLNAKETENSWQFSSLLYQV